MQRLRSLVATGRSGARFRAAALTALVVLCGSCAPVIRQTGSPGPEHQTPAEESSPGQGAPVPAGEHSGLEADLRAAIDQLTRGDRARGQATLEALLDRKPHPFRATAAALLARLRLIEERPQEAQTLLDRARPREPDQAFAFVAALVQARLMPGEKARRALLPFAPDAAPAVPGFSTEENRLALLAAWAESNAAAGHPDEALEGWRDFYESGNPHEKAYAVRRAQGIAAALPPEDALIRYEKERSPLLQLALGTRAVAALMAAGHTNQARDIESTLARLRGEAHASGGVGWTGRGDPARFGLAVPLSGSARALGVAVTRGGMLAIGPATRLTDVAPFQLVTRDAGQDKSGAGAATGQLSREEAVIGVVGLPDQGAIDGATRDGVPYLSLGDRIPGAGSTAFALVHGMAARIDALVRAARARGIQRFAVFRPDNESGKRAGELFAAGVKAAGAIVVADAVFAADSTSFTAAVEPLRRQRFSALFIPADATALELIAPALAVADLWPEPFAVGQGPAPATRAAGAGGRKNNPRRPILLLSTANGLSSALLSRAGRYVQGALLAPGFFPAPAMPNANGKPGAPEQFASGFRDLFGREPSATDAFGFDGVQILRACVEAGARDRVSVLTLLTSREFPGASGRLRFGPDHARRDPALVFEVEGDEIRATP